MELYLEIEPLREKTKYRNLQLSMMNFFPQVKKRHPDLPILKSATKEMTGFDKIITFAMGITVNSSLDLSQKAEK